MYGVKKWGFYLNGQTLLKTVHAKTKEAAKKKLDFMHPVNFNIQIKEEKR